MREYKFRAWDIEHQLMLNIFDSEKQKDWFLPNWKKHYKVMQWIGIKDKNDVDIYEGDVIKFSDVLTGQVIFNDKNACWCIKYNNVKKIYKPTAGEWLQCYKIIGNIYENPELMNR